MRLQLHILDRPADIRSIMLSDGWRLEGRQDGELEASHPAVTSEPAARTRLDRVGLLTSSHLQIRFVHDSDSSRPSRRPRS